MFGPNFPATAVSSDIQETAAKAASRVEARLALEIVGAWRAGYDWVDMYVRAAHAADAAQPDDRTQVLLTNATFVPHNHDDWTPDTDGYQFERYNASLLTRDHAAEIMAAVAETKDWLDIRITGESLDDGDADDQDGSDGDDDE